MNNKPNQTKSNCTSSYLFHSDKLSNTHPHLTIHRNAARPDDAFQLPATWLPFHHVSWPFPSASGSSLQFPTLKFQNGTLWQRQGEFGIIFFGKH